MASEDKAKTIINTAQGRFHIFSFSLTCFLLGILPVFFIMYSYNEFLELKLAIIAEHWLYFSLIGAAVSIAYINVAGSLKTRPQLSGSPK